MKFEMADTIIVIVFFISFYGLITGKNVIQSAICIAIMEISAIMFLLNLGYESGMMPPTGMNLENAADPLPQALTITAIVIGLAITAVNLAVLMSLFRQSNSTDWDVLQKKSKES